jgi:hypothetical protein
MSTSWRFGAVAGLLLAMVASGCSSPDGPPAAQPLTTVRPNPPVSMDTGIGWLVDVFADGCVYVREAELSTPCVATDVPKGSTRVLHFRKNGTHLVVVAVARAGPITGGWSTKRVDDDTTFVQVQPELQLGVIALDGDDEAKHVDLRAADGTLLQTLSIADG